MKNLFSKELMKKYAFVVALSVLLGFIGGWYSKDEGSISSISFFIIIIDFISIPIFIGICLLFAVVRKWRNKLRWAFPVLISLLTILGITIVSLPAREKYDNYRRERARLEQIARHPALIDTYIAAHRTTTAKEFSRYELVDSRDDYQFEKYKYSYAYLFEYSGGVTDTVFFVFEGENSQVEVSENFEKNPFTPTEEQLLNKLGISFNSFNHDHYNSKLNRLLKEEEKLFNSYLNYFNKQSTISHYNSEEIECKLNPMMVAISGFDLYYWDETNVSIPKTMEEISLITDSVYINHLSCRKQIPAQRRSTILLTPDRAPSTITYFHIPVVKGDEIIRACVNGTSFSKYSHNYAVDAILLERYVSIVQDTMNEKELKNYMAAKIEASLAEEFIDAMMLPYKQDVESRKFNN